MDEIGTAPTFQLVLRHEAVAGGYVSAEDFDRIVDPSKMIGPEA